MRLDTAAVQQGEVLHQGQSDPETALRARPRARALDEDVEHVRQKLGRDSRAVVEHAHGRGPLVPFCQQPDGAAAGGVLRSIRQQVAEDLREPRDVRIHHQSWLDVHDQAMPGPFESRCGRLDRLGENRGNFHALALELDLAARDASDVEQVVDEALQLLHLPFDDGNFAAVLVQVFLMQELDRRDDRGQRIAQLVAEHREELVLRADRFLAFPEHGGVLEPRFRQRRGRAQEHGVRG